MFAFRGDTSIGDLSDGNNVIEILATDLDGTLIPLDGNPVHISAMEELAAYLDRHDIELIFVSGRSWELTQDAMQRNRLPEPDVVICDVGTRIMVPQSETFSDAVAYVEHLRSLIAPWTNRQIRDCVVALGCGIRSQGEDRQTDFKASFFFDLSRQQEVVDAVSQWIERDRVPVSMIVSKQIDGDSGLLDLLPKGVHKGFALDWWLATHSIAPSSVVFCGDSGNDVAAITGPVNGVAVGNADHHLREIIDQSDDDTIYQAAAASTSGVLEGLLHFCQRPSQNHDVQRDDR